MTAKKPHIQPAVKPEPVVAPKPTTHTVVEGDTYASIAAAHLPAGTTKHAYAQHLYTINNGAKITVGKQIRL